MWKHQSALLALLTALASDNVTCTWNKKHQKAFDAVKKLYQQNASAYSKFDKMFDIHTDTSDLQLGTVINQNGKPIVFIAES